MRTFFLALIALSVFTLTQAGARADLFETTQDPDGAPWKLRLWTPPNLPVVQGVIVVGDGFARAPLMPQLQAIGANLGFGILGTESYREDGSELILNGLKDLAEQTGRAELQNVPFVGLGNSNGGMLVLQLARDHPRRMICVTPAVGILHEMTANPQGILRLAEVPTVFGIGEWDNQYWPTGPARKVFTEGRKMGAPWALIIEENTGHAGEQRRLYDLFLPYLQQVTEARYPQDADPAQGPVELKSFDPGEGSIMFFPGDHQYGDPGMPEIIWNLAYNGALEQGSYLPNRDLAWLARAAATHDRPLRLNLDREGMETTADYEDQSYLSSNKVFNPGEPVEVRVGAYAASFDEYTLYEGSQWVHDWQNRSRVNFLKTTLTPGPGVHGYVATGLKSDDLSTHTSPPMRAIVRGGPGRVHSPWKEGEPPSILVQPAPRNAEEGQTATLAAYAAGGPEIRYTWLRDGEPIEPGTPHANILHLTNLTPADAGQYTLKITNPAGSVETEAVSLEVAPFSGPQIHFGSSPIPESAEWTTMRKTIEGAQVPEENSARFRAWADRYDLWLEVSVQDPSQDIDAPAIWGTDVIEIFVEGSNEKTLTYGNDAYQFVISRSADHALMEAQHGTVPEGAESQVEELPGQGWTARLKIPWLALNRAPRGSGDEFIGLEIIAGLKNDGKISWHTARNVAWEGPHRLGVLKIAAP